MGGAVLRFLKRKSIPNWIPLTLGLVSVILVALGWKVTYNPQLENSWNAIDAVGNWISALISGVAIWFAVLVPKRIAQGQNDIALFEKRFSSYNVFLKYTSFADKIQKINKPHQLRQEFDIYFAEYCGTLGSKELIVGIKNDERQMMSGLFLFANFCDGTMIREIVQGMVEVISLLRCEETEFSEDDKNRISFFCKKCAAFSKAYMGEMRKQMLVDNP